MKEHTLFERITMVLGVIVSIIVWVIRVLSKLVFGMVKSRTSGSTSGSGAAVTAPRDAKREFQATTPTSSSQMTTQTESVGSVSIDESDGEDDDEDGVLGTIHFRDVPDTVVHPEDDPDHEDHEPIHFRDVADTVVHPEEDPDHEAHEPVHFRDVADTVDEDAVGLEADEIETATEPAADASSADDVPTASAGSVQGDGTNVCPAEYPIKGNASSRIYHMPGSHSYEQTIAEVCFATEEDAIAAGFRAPRQ